MSLDQREKPQSYYDLLELAPGASDEDIKRAYRRLALKYHPDRWDSQARRMAELRFRAINEAYAHLKTSQRRAHYDEILSARNDNTKASGFWGIIADIFKPSGKVKSGT